jgi:hypothetical protein
MARALVLNSPAMSEALKDPLPFRDFDLQIECTSIKADMRIWHDAGELEQFEMTVMQQPWPRVGKRIAFFTDKTAFSGLVKHTELSCSIHERWQCRVRGDVLRFEVKD